MLNSQSAKNKNKPPFHRIPTKIVFVNMLSFQKKKKKSKG